jgi:hypothetical protein
MAKLDDASATRSFPLTTIAKRAERAAALPSFHVGLLKRVGYGTLLLVGVL